MALAFASLRADRERIREAAAEYFDANDAWSAAKTVGESTAGQLRLCDAADALFTLIGRPLSEHYAHLRRLGEYDRDASLRALRQEQQTP